MDASTTSTPQPERTLISQGLHWGVFITPLVIAAATAMPWLMLSSFLTGMARTFGAPIVRDFMWFPNVISIVPGLILLWLAYLTFQNTEYSVTTRRVTFSTGWVFRARGELPLTHIETVLLMDPPIGRLLGYGTVILIGTGGTRFPLRFIPSPQFFHSTLQRALEAVQTGVPIPVPAIRQPQRQAHVSQSPIASPPSTYRPQVPSVSNVPGHSGGKKLEPRKTTLPPPEDDSRYQPKPGRPPTP